MGRIGTIARRILRGSPEVHHGQIAGLPVEEPVEILRDRWGIPHIFARSERDLAVGQGFVHAQDRLWQMETLRRLCAGKLAEIAGAAAVGIDHFTHILGLPGLWSRALGVVGDAIREHAEAYAAGVNACVASLGDALPLEFRTLRRRPSPWTWRDVYAFLPYLAWNQQANYLEELAALLARGRVTAAQWNELYPSHPGSRLREEGFFEAWGEARFGRLGSAALAMFPKLEPSSGGSNAFAVAQGSDGSPILANDPHLGLGVPAVWYYCHLACPTLNVAGASIPGTPGVVIGRNARVAWGYTAVMTDYVDLVAVRVDPARPTTYYRKGQPREMTRQDLDLAVAGVSGGKRRLAIYRTEYGPVITTLEPGVNAAACLRWFGTLPEGALHDTTITAYHAALKVSSVKEAMANAERFVTTCFNLTCADVDGHVGWHAMGRVPDRRGATGRVPTDGSAGEGDWVRFVPFEHMPHAMDPRGGVVITANQRTQTDRDGQPLTHSWCSPYRFDRIRELLNGTERPSPEDFARIQMDDLSPQAVAAVPNIVSHSYTHPDAVLAASILSRWDHRMSVASSGASVFGVFLVELGHLLASAPLRDEVGFFLSSFGYLYSAVDRILLSPAAAQDANPLLLGRGVQVLFEEALVRAVQLLRRTLGRRVTSWRWGRLHTYHFHHLGASGGLASWLLDRGPYPAPGSGATVNVGLHNPATSRARAPEPLERFRAGVAPSMRMICPMGDLDGTLITGPMGQSGQPSSRHYDDLLRLWRAGAHVRLPLSRKGAEAVAVATLVLAPA